VRHDALTLPAARGLRHYGGGLTLRRRMVWRQTYRSGVAFRNGLKRDSGDGVCRRGRRAGKCSADTARVQQRAPHLLADIRDKDIIDNPYAHFTRSDILPAETYAALEADFPRWM